MPNPGYDARYFGSHCDIEITVTARAITQGRHPAPVLDSYRCPLCKTPLTLVLIEVGTSLSDEDDFDDDDLVEEGESDEVLPAAR